VRCEKEETGITKKRQRLIEDRGAGESKTCTDIHGIPHEPVRTLNHKPARQIEGRWGAFSDKCEGEYPPHSDRRTGESHDDPGDLRRFNRVRPDHTRPRQEPSRKVDKHEANEKYSVRNRTDKNKHVCV
jgi:hypothetical protein